MNGIGVQTKHVVEDCCPAEGFGMLKRAGFTCADFSLNAYLENTKIYESELNAFFSRPETELERYFLPHKRAAREAGIAINQMHMPYPMYVPGGDAGVNAYLWNEVAPKSIRLCAFFGCRYLVVHGFKLSRFLGSEEAEWERTQAFLEAVAPLAKELGVVLCMENLYSGVGGHIVEGPCCDAGKAVARIDGMNERYGAEVLGFCFDTGHANLVGLDFARFLTTLGGRLKVLHVHDNDGVSDLHQIPYTFARTRENRASTDWEGFLSGLRSIGFSGALSFETAPVLTAFPEALKMEALGMIAKIGEYFAGELGRS